MQCRAGLEGVAACGSRRSVWALASASGRHDSGGVTGLLRALLRGGTVTVPSPTSAVAVQEFRACVRQCERASAGVGSGGAGAGAGAACWCALCRRRAA